MVFMPVQGLVLATGAGAAGAIVYAVAPTLIQRTVARPAMVPASAGLQSLTAAEAPESMTTRPSPGLINHRADCGDSFSAPTPVLIAYLIPQ